MVDNTDTPQPTEKQILMERARKMDITFSNNISVGSLRAKIEAKMENQEEPDEIIEEAQDSLGDYTPAPIQPMEESPVASKPTLGLAPVTAPVVAPSEPVEDKPDLVAGIPVPEGFASWPEYAAHLQQENVRLLAKEAAIPVAPQSNPLAVDDEPAVPEKPESIGDKLRREQMKLVRVRITNMDPKKASLQGEIITIANRYLGNVRMFVPYGEVTDDGWHIPFCIYTLLNERKFLNIRTTKDRRTSAIKVESTWAKEFAFEILPPLNEEEISRLATAQLAAGSID